MKNLISFEAEAVGNWTARSILQQIAEKNGYPITYSKYGQQRLHIEGKVYAFDHIENIRSNPITIYIKRIEKEPRRKYAVHISLTLFEGPGIVQGFDDLKEAEAFFNNPPYGKYLALVENTPDGHKVIKSNY